MTEGNENNDINETGRDLDSVTPPAGKTPPANGNDGKGGGGDDGKGGKKPPSGYVPIGEVQKLRSESRALKAQLEALTNNGGGGGPKQPAGPPDQLKDPKGYAAWVQNEVKRLSGDAVAPVQAKLQQTNLRVSGNIVRGKLGEEKWKALNDWIAEQPDEFKAAMRAAEDPYGEALHYYRSQSTFSKLGDLDLDEWYEAETKRRSEAANEENGGAGGGGGDVDGGELNNEPARPKPLASTRSASTPSGKPAGPMALSDILKQGKEKRAAARK